MLKQNLALVALTLSLTATANAATLYQIAITGHVVPDNAVGSLGSDLEGRSFDYNATFELDINKAIDTRVNGGGWTVYQLNDGGNQYFNSVCIEGSPDLAGSNCMSSEIVEFEYNDNLAEDWSSDPTLQFLGLNSPDGTEFDALVLGFTDYATNLEFYATLLFAGDWFEGYNPATLPTTIDMSKYIGGGGEFALKTYNPTLGIDEVAGWGQFVVDSVSVSEVPIPAAGWLLGSGLLGLAGIARRRK